jgi:GTP pyrophosphokinase
MAVRCGPAATPYFSHPIEVAGILTDLIWTTRRIATALLHDTIETLGRHAGADREKLRPQCRAVVDGVTKLSKIEAQT